MAGDRFGRPRDMEEEGGPEIWRSSREGKVSCGQQVSISKKMTKFAKSAVQIIITQKFRIAN